MAAGWAVGDALTVDGTVVAGISVEAIDTVGSGAGSKFSGEPPQAAPIATRMQTCNGAK